MKYLRLVWTGLWRKRARTLFTLLSVVFAFVLFGMLQGIDTAFEQLVDQTRLDVLIVTNPGGLPLPLADLERIKAVQGVRGATYRSLFIGQYQSPRNIVVVLAIDPESFFAMNSVFTVPASQLQAFAHTRTGALISPGLARRMHWSPGTRVPIRAHNAPKTDGTSDWTVDVVGIFDIPGSPGRDESFLLMNYPYFDTARAADNGTVQLYQVNISDASQAAEISNTIDNLFANSSRRTHTETEKANAQGQLAQIGDFDFFVKAIVGAAFGTLLLLTGSTLMQAYRERIHEFAVMKTLGFTDGSVAALVLSEAVALIGTGALLGLLSANALLPIIGSLAGGALPGLHLPATVFAIGAGAALLLAWMSAVPATWQARRLSIIDALAVH
jgi:putative ABC transport system permease protein